LKDLIFRDWGRRTYTFGVVFPYSSQFFLLRQWLKSGGINPDVEVRVVIVPPSQMFPSLRLGYLDGYCVGEPWSSVAVEAGAGVCVATSEQLAPFHPEKVLMVRREFAEHRSEDHERLIAALIEACAWCDRVEHRNYLCDLLARPQYVNAPVECLRAGLLGPFALGERRFSQFPDHTIFSRRNANDPTDEKAAWVMDQLYELMERRVLKTPTYGRVPALKNVFRRDIYERAHSLMGTSGYRDEFNENEKKLTNETHPYQTIC
jgi:ABC-type nitrate/sulfonate/bicarbonate transport system substrate-binding protein